MSKEPNLRAVPNPTDDQKSETREMVKTVALTSVVSSIVGVFAVAGGQALLNMFRRRSRRQFEEQVLQAVGSPTVSREPTEIPRQDAYDEMPDALRMEPRLRPTGGRRRRAPPPGLSSDQVRQLFQEFEQRQEKRFRDLVERIDELDEEEDE